MRIIKKIDKFTNSLKIILFRNDNINFYLFSHILNRYKIIIRDFKINFSFFKFFVIN